MKACPAPQMATSQPLEVEAIEEHGQSDAEEDVADALLPHIAPLGLYQLVGDGLSALHRLFCQPIAAVAASDEQPDNQGDDQEGEHSDDAQDDKGDDGCGTRSYA